MDTFKSYWTSECIQKLFLFFTASCLLAEMFMLNFITNAFGKPIQFSHHLASVFTGYICICGCCQHRNDGGKLDNPFIGLVSSVNQIAESL